MRGPRIARGEIWHDWTQRRLLFLVVGLATLPLLGLFAHGAGLLGLSTYYAWVLAPVLALLAGAAAYASAHHHLFAQRMGLGFLAGLLAAIFTDAAQLLGHTFGLFSRAQPFWPGLGLGGEGPFPMLAGLSCQWLATGALWGMAYGLLWGKVRWSFGPLAASAMWGVCVLAAWLLPVPILAEESVASFAAMAVAFWCYGVCLGGLNELLQPAGLSAGKIIFLRDYQPRAKPPGKSPHNSPK